MFFSSKIPKRKSRRGYNSATNNRPSCDSLSASSSLRPCKIVYMVFVVLVVATLHVRSKLFPLTPAEDSKKVMVVVEDSKEANPKVKQVVTLKDNNNCQFSYKELYNKTKYKNVCNRNTCLSQKDQDLILDRIFNVIGTTNKYCVEFGFGYGDGTTSLTMESITNTSRKITSGLNTHKLIQKGWNHTFFDAEYGNEKIHSSLDCRFFFFVCTLTLPL